MACYSFEGLRPVVDPTSFVHPMASLIGDVIIGPGCYIGPFASLRGDFGRILVEGDASVQESCTVHVSAVQDCIIGRGATIGHGAVIHGCTIGENALIGMNSVVLDGAVIGAESLVGAMSLVKTGMQVAPRSLVAGNPGRVIRILPADQIGWRNDGDGEYQRLARRCLEGLRACEPLAEIEPGRGRNTGDARPVRLGRTTTGGDDGSV